MQFCRMPWSRLSVAARAALLMVLPAVSTMRADPPHPTALLTEAFKTRLPVHTVIGTDPVVLVDGKEKRIRQDTTFFAERAAQYGDGRVEFKRYSLNGLSLRPIFNDEDDPTMSTAPLGGQMYFEATLQPTVEIRVSPKQ